VTTTNARARLSGYPDSDFDVVRLYDGQRYTAPTITIAAEQSRRVCGRKPLRFKRIRQKSRDEHLPPKGQGGFGSSDAVNLGCLLDRYGCRVSAIGTQMQPSDDSLTVDKTSAYRVQVD
jgi:hypothetical protein